MADLVHWIVLTVIDETTAQTKEFPIDIRSDQVIFLQTLKTPDSLAKTAVGLSNHCFFVAESKDEIQSMLKYAKSLAPANQTIRPSQVR